MSIGLMLYTAVVDDKSIQQSNPIHAKFMLIDRNCVLGCPAGSFLQLI